MKLREFLKKQANYRIPGTRSWKMRQKRMDKFNLWFHDLFMQEADNSRIIHIIDVGGVPDYWKYTGFKYTNNVIITTLNLSPIPVPNGFEGRIVPAEGTAINMKEYKDDCFDLAYSNSVIEHVGDFEKQKMMAKEIRRVAPHGYLQTPNKYFFMEPHFLFPYFQLIPRSIRIILIKRFQLGNYKRASSKEEAEQIVDSVRLLSYKDILFLFPKTEIVREKWMGLTKSFVVKW